MKVWIVYKAGAIKPIWGVFSSEEAAKYEVARIEGEIECLQGIRDLGICTVFDYEIQECEVTGLTRRRA